MKKIIIIMLTTLIFACSESADNTVSEISSDDKKEFDLSTAKGLCLYVISEAEKEEGENAPPAVVTSAYKTITCQEVTNEYIPQWQCMKDQMDAGKGFYTADEHCADI